VVREGESGVDGAAVEFETSVSLASLLCVWGTSADGQDVDPLADLGVDDHGGVAVPALEREVIDAEHVRDVQRRQRAARGHAHSGRTGDGARQHAGAAGARPAR
jgi:hypothetical protein